MPRSFTDSALSSLSALSAVGDSAFSAACDTTDLVTFQERLTATRDALQLRAQGDPSLAPALAEADANLLELELELAALDLSDLNS